MEAGVEGADETMQVFGEAFMRLVRERLRLRVNTSVGTGGKVHLTLMLVDEAVDRLASFPDQKIICSETITLEVAIPPQLTAKQGY